MKTAANHVAIEFDKSRDDEIMTKSGLTLYVPTMEKDPNDPRMETDMNAIRTWGKVAATPFKLNNKMILPLGKQVKGKDVNRTAADIEPEVQVGDIIHFRYLAMETSENRITTSEGTFQMIPYPDIFGIEREDGTIHPIGSYVFIEPVYEKVIESDLIIIPDEFNKKKTEKGKVLYIGTPFKDEPGIEVEEGDVVIYKTDWAEKHKLRTGDWVEVIYQDDVLAIVEDE